MYRVTIDLHNRIWLADLTLSLIFVGSFQVLRFSPDTTEHAVRPKRVV